MFFLDPNDVDDVDVDDIIDVVAAARQPRDLTPFRAELRWLIACTRFEFEATKDHFDPRINQPSRDLNEAHPHPSGRRVTRQEQREWRTYWDEHHKAGRGRPPRNDDNPLAPPPFYLRHVYEMVEAWWKLHVTEVFYPWFNGEPDLETANASARLMLLIAWDCNMYYTPANVVSLTDEMKRRV